MIGGAISSSHHRIVPGAPTALSATGTTSTSVTVTWSPPTSGGTLDYGAYTLQDALHSGAFSPIATVRYCTPGNGSAPNSMTDSFGNVWAIGPTGPNGVYVNGVYDSPTNGVTLMYLVAGVVWQLGGGSWWSITPTQNYGATPPTGGAGGGFAGPFSASPLVITQTGLTTNQAYDFRVNVSNSGGLGPFSSTITATPSGLTGAKLYGGNFDVPGTSTAQANCTTWVNTQGQAPQIEGGLDSAGMGAISNWAGSINFGLNQQRTSANVNERNAVPSIDIAFTDGSKSIPLYCVDIANGLHDTDLNNCLASCKTNGYNTVYIRPGHEYNYQVAISDGPSFISAWQHLYTLYKNYASANGMTVIMCWSMGQDGTQSNVSPFVPVYLWPGAAFVDVITLDEYGAALGGGGSPTRPLLTNTCCTTTMATYACNQGVKFGWDEVGAGPGDTTFPSNLALAIENVASANPGKLVINHIICWDRTDGGTSSLLWSTNAASGSAWLSAKNRIFAASAG